MADSTDETEPIEKTDQSTGKVSQDLENSQENKENSVQGFEDPENILEYDHQEPDNSPKSKTTEQAPKIKKPKMEIELDLKLLEDKFDDGIVGRCKLRQRTKVVKYEDIPLSRAEHKKKEILKRDKLKRIKYEDGEEEFVCEICKVPFMTIQALIGHRKSHFKVLKFTCALCSQPFNTNAELIKHKIAHSHEEREFLCMKCKTAFTNHLDYLKHKLTHQNLLKYKCIECGKEYDQKKSFVIHIETHFDYTTECEICHQTYKRNSMQNHMLRHKKKIQCEECGKECVDKKGYDYHMISHTGVKPYQCLYCGRGFSNEGQRKVHTRLHTNEKPYECKICHHKSRQSGDLKLHMNTHKTEKTEQCGVCHKKFFWKQSLRDHMDIHNNTQKHKCGICNKPFHTKTSLTSHLQRNHSNVKLFHCVPCNRRFATSSDLGKHRKQRLHLNIEFAYYKKIKTEKSP